MIKEDFIHIAKRDTLEELRSSIRDESLTFIGETGTILHKGKEYLGPKVGTLGTPPDPIYNYHPYVDMGEAGIWATCNIGAENPWDYGLYFAWGETEGYAEASAKSGGFDWATTPYWKSGTSAEGTKWSKYTATDGYSSDGKADNKLTLEPEDDAAHVIMKGQWKIPTLDELLKLNSACNKIWTTQNGVYGRLFTLKTDSSKQLFFPAAGYADGTSMKYVGSYCYYWLSLLVSSDIYNSYSAYNMRSNSSSFIANGLNYRCNGLSIRAFIPKS